MRVPVTVVIFLSLGTIGGVWWWNTRHMDFVTPPSNARIEALRAKAEELRAREAAMVTPDDEGTGAPLKSAVATPTPEPTPPPAPPPPDFGDLGISPGLNLYQDRKEAGADTMVTLAKALEEKGEAVRALLAWERLMDTVSGNEEQTKMAMEAIARLRGSSFPWVTDQNERKTVVLRAEAPATQSEKLKPLLDRAARVLGEASSGQVNVKVEFSPVRVPNAAANAPAKPIALRFLLPGQTPADVDVITCTPTTDADVLAAAFRLIANRVAKDSSLLAPRPLASGDVPTDALRTHMTRLHWQRWISRLGSAELNR